LIVPPSFFFFPSPSPHLPIPRGIDCTPQVRERHRDKISCIPFSFPFFFFFFPPPLSCCKWSFRWGGDGIPGLRLFFNSLLFSFFSFLYSPPPLFFFLSIDGAYKNGFGPTFFFFSFSPPPPPLHASWGPMPLPPPRGKNKGLGRFLPSFPFLPPFSPLWRRNRASCPRLRVVEGAVSSLSSFFRFGQVEGYTIPVRRVCFLPFSFFFFFFFSFFFFCFWLVRVAFFLGGRNPDVSLPPPLFLPSFSFSIGTFFFFPPVGDNSAKFPLFLSLFCYRILGAANCPPPFLKVRMGILAISFPPSLFFFSSSPFFSFSFLFGAHPRIFFFPKYVEDNQR